MIYISYFILWRLSIPQSVGQNGNLEILVRAVVLSIKPGNSGRISLLQYGGRVPSLGTLLRPSIDWMKPTHIIKPNLLYLKLGDCKCGSRIKINFAATSRLVSDQTTILHCLVKLTYKINHLLHLEGQGKFYREDSNLKHS